MRAPGSNSLDSLQVFGVRIQYVSLRHRLVSRCRTVFSGEYQDEGSRVEGLEVGQVSPQQRDWMELAVEVEH